MSAEYDTDREAILRDLRALVSERVGTALNSVLQLDDDPRAKLQIAMMALGDMIGATAGIFAAMHGFSKEEGLGREIAIHIIDETCALRDKMAAERDGHA